MSDDLERTLRDGLRSAAHAYESEGRTDAVMPVVAKRVLRRRRTRMAAVTMAVTAVVALSALTVRLDHAGSARVTDGPAPVRLSTTTTEAGTPLRPPPGASREPSSAAVTSPETTVSPAGCGPGCPGAGARGAGSLPPTRSGLAPSVPVTASTPPSGPHHTSPSQPVPTVTTVPPTPTTIQVLVTTTTLAETSTTVPSSITYYLTSKNRGGTLRIAVGDKIVVDLEPSCPGSTWSRPRSTVPSVLERTTSPPATAAGAVAATFLAAAPGSTRLTALVRGEACPTPATTFAFSVVVSS